ncbi:hypothetical protein AOLI_G00068490 [Acnodon oligacanthus]
MGGDRQCEVEMMLKQSQRELQWIQKQLSIISNRTNGPMRAKEKVEAGLGRPQQYLHTLAQKNVNTFGTFTLRGLLHKRLA